MKKYKLIKEYPGSLELGSIASSESKTDLWKGTNYYDKYPEFWEEVIEKDYEILSFKQDSGIADLWTKFHTNTWGRNVNGQCATNPYTTEEILSNKLYAIHSVKRLSDGEVFTVGDKITGYHKDSRSIQKIRICPYTGRIRLEQSGGYTDLVYANKAKQPIFLTHDGKDIFEGDKVWSVNKQDHYKSYFTYSNPTQAFHSDVHAYFLTKEAAENYIEKNKVLFTTEDGVGIKRGDTFYFVDTDLSINLSNASTGCGQYSERKYFSTFEPALYYVVVNAKVLSIEDFYNAISSQYGNGNKLLYLQRLVKQRLNLK